MVCLIVQLPDSSGRIPFATCMHNEGHNEVIGASCSFKVFCVHSQLEQTIVQLQRETKESQEKLANHDAAAKRAISSLQNELKQRLENVSSAGLVF